MKIAVATWLRGALLDNLGLKVLSMILALTVFLLVNTDEKREINAVVRVAYELPPGKALVSERIDQVKVTVRGPWRLIRRFDERQIDPIDLGEVPEGEVAITPKMIHLPRGLEITSIQPEVIRVAFEDIQEKVVPVNATLAGRPLHGYSVETGRTTVDPPTVTVKGAAGLIRALEGVRTAEVRVDGRSDHFTTSVAVVPPPGVEVVDKAHAQVQVAVAIDEELVTRRLGQIAVTVRAPPGTAAFDPTRWQVQPATVDVNLTGDLLPIEDWIAHGVTASVTVPAADVAGTKPLSLPVVIDGAPPGVGIRLSPETVKLTPRKS